MIPILRHLAIISAIAVGGFYAYSILSGPRGLIAITQSRAEVQKMEQENERLAAEIRRHQKFIDDLRSKPELRDRIIRQRLEKQKPGETTILDTGKLPASPAAPIR